MNEAVKIEGRLRHNILRMPEVIKEANGIEVFGRKIRSFIFTTVLAIIKNCDADAILAVYPFTPQQSISEAIISSAPVPVFCGCGGGTTRGIRTLSLAKDVECQGAFGIVLNSPTNNANLKAVSLSVDIPVVITVTSVDTDFEGRIKAGASLYNVAVDKDTLVIVEHIR